MKKFFLITLFFIFSSFCFSKESDNFSIEHFVLENGLSLFVVEDDSLTTTTIRLNVKAGYAKQSPKNTGFFDLYTRFFLFGLKRFSSEELIEEEFKKLNIISFDSTFSADISAYQLKVPFFGIDGALALLAEASIQTSFSESAIEKHLKSMQKDIIQKAKMPTSYINSAIDSRIFAEKPWQHETGISPALFSKHSAGVARAQLSQIKEKFYTPANSALFICSNLPAEHIYQMVKSSFGAWKNPSLPMTSEDDFDNVNEIKSTAGTYILHSEEFPEDFMQIIVQYPQSGLLNSEEKSIFESETIALSAEIFQKDSSQLKKIILENGALGVPSPDFIYAGYANSGEKSRLIIQTLLEKRNIPQQIQGFVSLFDDPSTFLRDDELAQAKENLINSFNENIKSSSAILESFANSWAYVDKNYFFSFPKIINTLSKTKITQVLKSRPYVFVVINSKDFFNNKKDLTPLATEIITKENASWYTNTLYKTLEKKKQQEKKNVAIIESDDIQKINTLLEVHKSRLEKASLENGVQIFVRKNTSTVESSVELTFLGGEVFDSAKFNDDQKKRGSRLLAVTALARLISTENDFPPYAVLSIDSTLYSHTIKISSPSHSISSILSAIDTALTQEKYTPQIIDQSIWDVKQFLRNKYASNETRMIFSGLNALFDQNGKTKLLYDEKDLFVGIKFADVVSYCQELKNSDFLQVIITSNVETAIVLENAKKTFKPLSKTETNLSFESFQNKMDFYNFDIKNQILKLPLERIFLSNIEDPQNAQKPVELVPTKNFADPVIVFFKLPQYNATDYADMLFMLWSLEEKLRELLNESKNQVASSVRIQTDGNLNRIAYIVFTDVTRPRDLRRIFDRALILVKNIRAKNEVENKTEKKILFKDLFLNLENTNIYNTYLKTNAFFRNDAFCFLTDFQYINEVAWKDSARSFQTWLANTYFTWVFTTEARL
ncbi:MAG: M16 family metallopeptidase [Treponemataceae bacterium]